jgi:hypothetical protein
VPALQGQGLPSLPDDWLQGRERAVKDKVLRGTLTEGEWSLLDDALYYASCHNTWLGNDYSDCEWPAPANIKRLERKLSRILDRAKGPGPA